MDKKKSNKNISLPKVSLKSAIKKKHSAEGNKFKYLKEKNNKIDECDFNTAFVMAHITKCYSESYIEDDNNNELQFTQTHSVEKDLKKFSKKSQVATLKEMT